MNFQIFFKRSVSATFAVVAVSASVAFAQQPTGPDPILSRGSRQFVAEGNNLYCAGFVQTSPIDTNNKLVGAVEEQEQFNYAQNDVVYINMGANKGVQVGDVMAVVRPRGQVRTRWTRKDGLGFYVQEVGAVEILRVKGEVSVARIKTSCDTFLLGDLVQPVPVRTSPAHSMRPVLDLYADPSGKALGRLFMARDNQEVLTRDNVVYIDLGAEDNVQVGDYVTIFRPLGKGGVVRGPSESAAARSEGYQSFTFRGGKFSNQTARKSGETARGHVITTQEAKEDRPDNIRKIVGEAVILNVKERTATAVITKTAQEIHTGDWVEVQ